MANTRVLVKRRKAIRNIRKITRTMELIATTRFKKALDRASEAEAYTQKIAELAADLSQSAGDVQHPLLKTHDTIDNVRVLVICSNRGLCGGYNASIIREANHRLQTLRDEKRTVSLDLSGKRAITYFRFQSVAANATYTQFEDKPAFAEVEEIGNRYIEEYISGQIDRVEVAYMKFVNVARQTPVVETLLPLGEVVSTKVQAQSAGPGVDYEYLPSAADILDELVPVAFKIRLFKCFLDAAVGEQIARRIAMKAATENAADMIKALSREYNRVRQAQITKEIAEVIGGAEALK